MSHDPPRRLTSLGVEWQVHGQGPETFAAAGQQLEAPLVVPLRKGLARHRGTEAPRHRGTEAPRHRGTEAPRRGCGGWGRWSLQKNVAQTNLNFVFCL